MNKAVLFSNDLRVINEFTQICTVTGMHLEVVANTTGTIEDAICFVDSSCSDVQIDASNVHVICVGQPTSQVWLLAGQVNAQSILTLPHDRSPLIELLTPSITTFGKIISVTQASGGSGVTTLASALAHQLKNTARTCVLVEVSNNYTAFELAMGDLQSEAIYASHLMANPSFGVEGLNTADGLKFIANDAPHSLEQWIELISYLQGQFEFVVLDMSSDMHNAELLKLSDSVVVSLTNTIRQTAVTRILLNTLNELNISHGLAIRSLGGTSLNPLAIAEKLQTPLWVSLPTDNRIIEQIECGFGISMIRLASFTRAVSQVAGRLAEADNVRTA